MNETFFDEFQSSIIERLGKVYDCNSEYKKGIEKEIELFNQLKKSFTKEQMNMVED